MCAERCKHGSEGRGGQQCPSLTRLHRYEAAKAEGITELLCQVVELGTREARYNRIQACVGKPAELTRARALQELRLAFITDMHGLIGSPNRLYEPILGEDGQIHARPRTAQLPKEPLEALEVFTDHLRATETERLQLSDLTEQGEISSALPSLHHGWEQALTGWLAELGQRFGYDAAWLLQELHMQVLQQQGFGQDWTPRQREAFQRQGGYAFHALWLWSVPDVELRSWFRRKIQVDPSKGEWLWKSVQLLGLITSRQTEKPLQTLPKSDLLTLLTRYPSPRDLYQAIRDHLEGHALEAAPQSPTIRPELPPSTSSPVEQALPVLSTASPTTSAIFAVGSPGFFGQPPQHKEPDVPARPDGRVRPDPVQAYKPVHVAFDALLQAIQELTSLYGREWLQWELAHEDMARLRAALSPD